ncbi:unnamed protein product [Peniophora sp. CBMAI 1063]|nr:unnamed protein product [Peniophora sp. CBMAI 1063]
MAANSTLNGQSSTDWLLGTEANEPLNTDHIDESDADQLHTRRGAKAQRDDRSPLLHSRTCGCSKTTGRNLIVCIDGTSNQFGEKNTNVIELYSLIQKGESDGQLTWYNSGIGTYARPSWKSLSWYKQVLAHKIDLAIAWNFESIVLDAYRWLSETYKDGDCIYLFGFSRGAYQVRTLSAMIEKVGLIHRGNEKQIPFAYQWYSDPDSDLPITEEPPSNADAGRSPASSPDLHDSRPSSPSPHESEAPTSSQSKAEPSLIRTAKRFKQVFSRNVKVHFVGAWDTVSSIGIVRGRKLLPGTIDGMNYVCYFRHALALDERRVKFLPEYAHGGRSKGHGDHADANHTKEVWFAGTHSDIGGGNVENRSLDRTRPSLRWMFSEASAAGLHLDPLQLNRKDVEDIKVNESLTGIFWWLLEYLPLRRLTYFAETEEAGKDTTHQPHAGGVRVIQEGQKIHPSVWRSKYLGTDYIPRARLYSRDTGFWDQLKLKDGEGPQPDGTERNPWREVDLYDMVEHLVRQYTSYDSVQKDNDTQRSQLEAIRSHVRSGEGQKAVVRELYKRLELARAHADKNPEPKLLNCSILCRILQVVLEASDISRQAKAISPYRTLRALMLRHLAGANHDELRVAKQFLLQFTDTVQVLTGHDRPILSVAFSPDGQRIASGSYDDMVRIWDGRTGETVGKPFGHDDDVNSVAFSPDGKHVVSGSDDCTVRVWDVENGQVVGKPFEGHTDWVRSVAFSPDGQRIVSGSEDGTLRIWDARTGQTVGEPLKGHTSFIMSVAFSPDGTRVVSGSHDNTVRIWNVKTGQIVGDPLEGHTDMVFSVAFSQDGTRVVSGSRDNTLRIWNSETGKVVGKPFEGHRGIVFSVAFSPNGLHVVSGSDDCTVRIWDVETGEMVGKPYEGHTSDVTSVAFSPDGTRVVSGSWDRTIRIWDVLEPLLPQSQEIDVHGNAVAGRGNSA